MMDTNFLSCLEWLPEATPSDAAVLFTMYQLLFPLDKLQGEFKMIAGGLDH